MDRPHLAQNAERLGVVDPLARRPHIDLCAVLSAHLGRAAPIDRDELREAAALAPHPRRHRALDDALDLTHFMALLLDAPIA